MLLNLMAEMTRNKISSSDIASCLGCTEKTVKNKINEVTAFSYYEAVTVRNTFFPELETEYLFEQTTETVAKLSNIEYGDGYAEVAGHKE